MAAQSRFMRRRGEHAPAILPMRLGSFEGRELVVGPRDSAY
jgi:hypothetical protein